MPEKNLIENLLEPDDSRPVQIAPAVNSTRVQKAAGDLYRALKGFINASGHTDACMEIRRFGVPTCTKQCEAARKALEKATGVPVESKI